MKNKSLTHKTLIVIQVAVMAVFISGCLAITKEDIQPSVTSSVELQVSATPVLEYTATATALPTRKPTATFPPTRTPLPLQTDLPTIEPSDGNILINSLNSKCSLPCWGNIIPGKTSQYAAKRFLSPLGEWNEDNPSFTVQYNNTSATIDLTFKHGLVDSIQFPSSITKSYRINHLFTEYGMPEDVQVEVSPLTYDLTTWFKLILLYSRQGFFAILSAEGTVINSIINICPRDVSPDLYLFASDTYSLDEMNEIVSVVHPHIEFQPLDTVTDIDINQFYEIFRDQSVTCMASKFEFQLPP